MSVKDIRRFKLWASGRYHGTEVRVEKADYAKIKTPEIKKGRGYFSKEPSYLPGVKPEVRSFLKNVLHTYEEPFVHSHVRLVFFHESDALQFRLQFL